MHFSCAFLVHIRRCTSPKAELSLSFDRGDPIAGRLCERLLGRMRQERSSASPSTRATHFAGRLCQRLLGRCPWQRAVNLRRPLEPSRFVNKKDETGHPASRAGGCAGSTEGNNSQQTAHRAPPVIGQTSQPSHCTPGWTSSVEVSASQFSRAGCDWLPTASVALSGTCPRPPCLAAADRCQLELWKTPLDPCT